MADTAYPLTGKPYDFATLIEDGAAEDAEATRRGLALHPDVASAFGDLCRRAESHAESFMAGYRQEQRDEVAAHIAIVAAALARLVRVRVSATEAARMTDYDRGHIRRLIQSGALYAERQGQDYRIPVYALDALPPRSAKGRPKQSTTEPA